MNPKIYICRISCDCGKSYIEIPPDSWVRFEKDRTPICDDCKGMLGTVTTTASVRFEIPLK